jgi:GDP-L-fucose synthase
VANVLVLGGTGFVGRHVVDHLTRSGEHDVRSISRGEGVDILEAERFTKYLRDAPPDAVINCAAHVGSVHYGIAQAGTVARENMQLVMNMYEAVRQAAPAATIVNPLANCSYPGDSSTQVESDWERGPVHDSVLAFGAVKRMTYVFAECYRREFGTRTINWIIPNTYGPGDHLDPNKVHALNGIVLRLIGARNAGAETFEIWGTGKPLREWAYVEDVARILVDSVSRPEQIYPVNFAQNRSYSVTELAELIVRELGYDVEFTYDTSKPDGQPARIMDDAVFRAAFPDFEFTPMATGVRNTIAYYERALPPA